MPPPPFLPPSSLTLRPLSLPLLPPFLTLSFCQAWTRGAEKLEVPTDAFTGVAFKSEAELMVERGQAKVGL